MQHTQEAWSESEESSTAIHSMDDDNDISLGDYETVQAMTASNNSGHCDQTETLRIPHPNTSRGH